ncbi:sodium-coupled monocarboxylate transporter 1 isoform X2 [Lutzomyia longipalpis]|uniref:sodium-coupled monocarboxylate transporter 1 isoform X2 n=1 Tax=Lutzomyia longipalpis TaxID=7200 RepID=UPI0024839B2B|nr:sodium-coupled monocarboxylate transporter 1 isoform X2 [Lutzomyia longipalpis]
MQSLEELILRSQKFSLPDYLVFIIMLFMCILIGIYFGFIKNVDTESEYLVGGRNMQVLPIALSLIASFISGITLLGLPTEVYSYGTQYLYVISGVFLMAITFSTVYLPVFQGLNITSTYQGGLKAVVWTDVVQVILMFAALILVAIKGTFHVNGPEIVLKNAFETDRIEAPIFNIDPTIRHSFWCLSIGGLFYWVQTNASSQNMIQRYLSLPSLRESRRAVWIFVSGVTILMLLCAYNGLLIFTTYRDCDPLTTKLAKAKDQLLPLFVMDTLGELPGLSGMFIAGVFSAALSSLSTCLNSMSAVVLEDFCKPFVRTPLTTTATNWIMRSVVVGVGALCVCLVFVVEKMGTVLQLTMSLEAITNGPLLGIFTIGILLPRINGTSALSGGVFGVLLMSWISLNAQWAIASGSLKFDTKPMSIDGCNYLFNYTSTIYTTQAPMDPEASIMPLYRISYMWYTFLGTISTILVAFIVNLINGGNDPHSIDASLISPVIRKYYKNPAKVVKEEVVIKDITEESYL